MKQFVITIGRQLGSGGKEIAEMLARHLNIKAYDKTLLEEAARESGIDTTVFENADEQESESYFSGIFSIHGAITDYFKGDSIMDKDRLFEIQSETIQHLANRESCVIVGRCAEYVLRDHPAMLSIFITADREDRIGRIMKSECLEHDKAAEYLEKNDKRRRSYHDYYATTHWGEASSYDLCINSSRMGIEGTTEFILNFIKTRLAQ